MKQPRTTFAGMLLAAILALPAFADNSRAPAVPGTVNYVEGKVSIGSELVSAKSAGTTQLDPGQSLTADTGKTELLLTPGVFLRVGDHSSAQLVSSGLTNTEVAIDQGEAIVEVDEIHPQNNIHITENGARTQLLKTGLYDFDATHNLVRVVDGKAVVHENDHDITVKSGHELALGEAGKPKTEKFDKKNFEATDLYRWSSLRSDYLAEASVGAARTYVVGGWYGPGWIGPGWYWSPWYSAYTFVPGDGIFYSPFGWGFYSPFWAYRAPVFVRGGFGPGPVRIAHDPAPIRNRAVHVGEAPAHSFAGSARPMSPAGFHGGPAAGGGFHGFAGGGGFHR